MKAVLENKFNACEECAHLSPPVLQCSELGPSRVLQILPAYLSLHLCPLLPSAESRLHPSLHLCDLHKDHTLPGAPLCDVTCDILGWICIPFLSALTVFHLPFSSVQFSRSVVSDSLRPHESQHARPPCPSPTQTYVHRVGDAIQPSHPLSSPSPPAPNPSQHQGLFQ